MRECAAPNCGTLWLDPAPSEAGIGAAYVRYYTHESSSLVQPGAVAAAFRLLWRVNGLAAERAALERMLLDGVAPGLLLDVGCGDGRRLAVLQAMGWRVEGQEIDAAAVAAARRAGYTVHAGKLQSIGLGDGSYDAVTMNHVMEHVHDPLAHLQECRRVLRRGGRLVALTPNAASLGHAVYGAAWRGLEPPRHLQVFTAASLGALATRAGFSQVQVRTSAANAYTLAAASLDLAAQAEGRALGFVRGRLGALSFQWRSSRAARRNAASGEECLLTAVA